MQEHRVELKIIDWDDLPFREVVESAWRSIREGGMDADSLNAAARLQFFVRAAGYPAAIVEVHKTVDEALAHVAHFKVSREPAVVALSR